MEKNSGSVSDDNKVEEAKAIEYLRIQGANCASCVSKIEGALSQIVGVEQAVMNLAQSTVYVTGNAPVEAMVKAIKQTGYDAEKITDSTDKNILDEK